MSEKVNMNILPTETWEYQQRALKRKHQLAKQVLAHAEKPENYNKGGWDHVAECFTEWDVIDEIGNARTLQGAIRKMLPFVLAKRSQEKEIMATAW